MVVWKAHKYKIRSRVTNCLVLPFPWDPCPVWLSSQLPSLLRPNTFCLKAHHTVFLYQYTKGLCCCRLSANTSGWNQEIWVWLLAWEIIFCDLGLTFLNLNCISYKKRIMRMKMIHFIILKPKSLICPYYHWDINWISKQGIIEKKVLESIFSLKF